MNAQFLDKLNEPQKEAVINLDGPMLILAGAGSGKTRVLTCRVSRLIQEKKASPFEILAVTFTKKASQELKERVCDMVGPFGDMVQVATFHSLCARILRADADRIGYGRNFTILDTSDQQMVIKHCLKELGISGEMYKPQSVLSAISSSKNALVPKSQFADDIYDIRRKTIAKVYDLYQAKLKADNSMDYDDLLVLANRVLSENDDILEKYQNQYKYILVDEYQDTNFAQYMLVKMLAQKSHNLCVVGDDDQSIYTWRGADIRNILEFERDYPDAKVIKLEQNYRSTSNILNAANKVIKSNASRKDKALWTQREDGEKITVYEAENERDEGRYITDEINQLISNKNYSMKDVAILYRTNAQSRILEEVMLGRSMPYKIVGGIKFYDRKEIKDMLAYLKFIFNNDDSVSLTRIVNVPRRGIGDLTMSKLNQISSENDISLYRGIKKALADDTQLISSRAKKLLTDFIETVESFIKVADEVSVTYLAERIMNDTGYLSQLSEEKTIEAEGRVENLKEFLSVTNEFDQRRKKFGGDDGFGDLGMFLEEVALISDVDNLELATEKITLMTLHSAKGLEFPIVFIAGMEENIFPSGRSIEDYDALEEERRLCYVGITRAQDVLYMVYSRCRSIYGSQMMNPPSRFINELPKEIVDMKVTRRYGITPTRRYAPDKGYNARFNSPSEPEVKEAIAIDSFSVGDKVFHSVFGEGLIVAIKPSGKDYNLSVAFPDRGVKELAASFAPIKKI